MDLFASGFKGTARELAGYLSIPINVSENAVQALSRQERIKSVGTKKNENSRPAKIWAFVKKPKEPTADSITKRAMKNRTPMEKAWMGVL